ncbi:GNAT family N-acetyltransferase [Halobacillus sp. Nhm2S1]|uniref:GNAT family N-acetyltransferase n=1 Tax=Halobacillus sp. Nhm2S1 TaxID=2866716 RepID=UPI001C733E5E|nr:GNAT family N-acetyltransferase [Halobacillus sp. Nhm2S1]MBX0357262.1 GNAT family N-acetyltransferase [Halobacillus sp. Nhm2S1]
MIKTAEVYDAEAYQNLIEQLESETDFLLYGKDERKSTIEKVKGLMQRVGKEENSTIILSELDGGVIGHVTVFGGGAPRTLHTASVITGVLKDFHGQGVAKELFYQLFQWAEAKGVTRLELTVMVHNERAVRFYERMGFEKEGVKRQSLMINESPVDEYIMAKILV